MMLSKRVCAAVVAMSSLSAPVLGLAQHEDDGASASSVNFLQKEKMRQSCKRHWGMFHYPEDQARKNPSGADEQYYDFDTKWKMEVFSNWQGKTEDGLLDAPKTWKNKKNSYNWEENANKLNRVIVILPEFNTRDVVDASKNLCEEFSNEKKFHEALDAAHWDVVVPLFRPQQEAHHRHDAPKSTDKLVFGETSNGLSNKGGYSTNFEKANANTYHADVPDRNHNDPANADFTSYEVMDQIVARLLEKTKTQIIIAGHSGGCQFAQRWSMVSNIPRDLFKDIEYIDVVYGSCGSYGYLDFTRPKRGWMTQYCSGRDGDTCRPPQSTIDDKKSPEENEWTTDLRSGVLLDEVKDSKLYWGRLEHYMPLLRHDPDNKHRRYASRRPASGSESYPAFVAKLLQPTIESGGLRKELQLDAVCGYQRNHADTIRKSVTDHLNKMLERFSITLLLNKGDRCNCVGNEHRQKEVRDAKIPRQLQEQHFLDPSNDGPCKHESGEGYECKGHVFGHVVDNNKYALLQGFTRYQRGRAFQFWLEERIGTDHERFTTRLCHTCQHTWTNGKDRIAELLSKNRVTRGGDEPSSSGLRTGLEQNTNDSPRASVMHASTRGQMEKIALPSSC
eukprot:g8540.t1